MPAKEKCHADGIQYTYVSIQKFSEIANVKVESIMRKRSKIPVIVGCRGKYKVLEGTRYPCAIKRYKLKNTEDKRYALLKAISQEKYINHTMLGLYAQSFRLMLKQLLDARLIIENGMCNQYGANAYDCTALGDEVLRKRKSTAQRQIVELVSSGAGNFVGTVLSKVYSEP